MTNLINHLDAYCMGVIHHSLFIAEIKII